MRTGTWYSQGCSWSWMRCRWCFHWILFPKSSFQLNPLPLHGDISIQAHLSWACLQSAVDVCIIHTVQRLPCINTYSVYTFKATHWLVSWRWAKFQAISLLMRVKLTNQSSLFSPVRHSDWFKSYAWLSKPLFTTERQRERKTGTGGLFTLHSQSLFPCRAEKVLYFLIISKHKCY